MIKRTGKKAEADPKVSDLHALLTSRQRIVHSFSIFTLMFGIPPSDPHTQIEKNPLARHSRQ
jgi:hypothetical protein